MVKESNVQRSIMSNLKKIPNSEWQKATTTNRAGAQDIIGHIQGYYIAFEVKRSNKEEPSDIQKYRIRKTNSNGGFSRWVSSWRQTKDYLLEFANTKNIHHTDLFPE